MTKTMTATRRVRNTNYHAKNRIAQDVDRIIKKAMGQTSGNNVRKKIKKLIKGSLENAKEKTETLQENVANYAYKKPLRTLGLAAITGAAIALMINRGLTSRPRRRFFG